MEFARTKKLELKINESQAHNLSSKSKIEKMLKEKDVFGFNIYDNDDLIGFAMLKEFDEGKFFLWDYFIDFDHQNKGYGTQALQELITLFESEFGCKVMTTTYKFGNEPAKRLYEKTGFIETDIVNDGDVHEVNMILEL